MFKEKINIMSSITYGLTKKKKKKLRGCEFLIKKNLVKPSLKIFKTSSKKKYGRSSGKIVCRHKMRGTKKKFNLINFNRRLLSIWGKVIDICYDSNRTSFITLLKFADGSFYYTTCPLYLNDKQKIRSTKIKKLKKSVIFNGWATSLKNFQNSSFIYNIEKNNRISLVRAAGCRAILGYSNKKTSLSHIKLPSGTLIKLPIENFATFGQISNKTNKKRRWGKAGVTHQKGYRPCVRGIAMNPVDHPNGGRTHGGKVWRSPWGKLAK